MHKRRRDRRRRAQFSVVEASKQALGREPAPGQSARQFERMNERKAPRRVKPVEPPRYLTDAARGVFRRVAKYALAPFALARAVVDRFRDKD